MKTFCILATAVLLASTSPGAVPGSWIPKPTTSSQPAATQAAHVIKFNGMAWGSRRDAVKAAMETGGFTLDAERSKASKYQDYLFTGKLVNQKCLIGCLFDPQGGLTKVSVNLLTKDQDARECYENTREMLILRYGKPTGSAEKFSLPFKKGDGDEELAIKSGKAYIATV